MPIAPERAHARHLLLYCAQHPQGSCALTHVPTLTPNYPTAASSRTVPGVLHVEVYPPLSSASSHPSAHLLNHSAMRSPPTLLTHATAQLLHPAHHAQGTSCLFQTPPPPASPHPPAHLLHDCAHHAQGAYVLTHKQRLAARLTNALACRRTGTNSKADTQDTCMYGVTPSRTNACMPRARPALHTSTRKASYKRSRTGAPMAQQRCADTIPIHAHTASLCTCPA